MGRKILLITTDQQRHDALGCNGGAVARTPAIDGLAASGGGRLGKYAVSLQVS
jgi:arylsulfatase A-like enzyme